MAEQPPAIVVADRDAPELIAVDVGQPVVARQPLVHEGVVRTQQIEHAVVLEDDALEQQLGLALQRLPQVVVEIGEHILVGTQALQVAQVQPLAGEVAAERSRALIGQHPLHLLGEDRADSAACPGSPGSAADRRECCSR